MAGLARVFEVVVFLAVIYILVIHVRGGFSMLV